MHLHRLDGKLGGDRVRKAAVGVALGIGLVVALAGCTYTDNDTPSGTPSLPSITMSPAATPTFSAPKSIEHYTPPGEDVVGSIDEQTGSATLGPFHVKSKFVKVYLTCLGQGNIVINPDGIGTFPLPCTPDAVAPSVNEFQVNHLEKFKININAEPGQRWAATVAFPGK